MVPSRMLSTCMLGAPSHYTFIERSDPAVDKPVAEDQAVEVQQEGVSTEGLSGSPLQLGLQELQFLHASIKPEIHSQ